MKLLFVFVALSLAGALRGVQVSPVEIGASSSAGMSSWPHRNLEVSWGASRIGRLPNAESFPSLPSESGGFRSMTGPSVALVGRKVAQRLCVDCNKRKKKKKKRFRHGPFARRSKGRIGRCGVSFFLVFFSRLFISNNQTTGPFKTNETKQKNSPAATLNGASATETGPPSRSSGTSTSTACRGSSRRRRATRTSSADRRGTTRKPATVPASKTSRNMFPTRIRAAAIYMGSSCFLFLVCLFVPLV